VTQTQYASLVRKSWRPWAWLLVRVKEIPAVAHFAAPAALQPQAIGETHTDAGRDRVWREQKKPPRSETQWFKLKGCVAEENRIAPAGRRQFRPGFGLTCLVTFAAEIDFLDSSVWLIGIFAPNLN
jgi:hypothetical protein